MTHSELVGYALRWLARQRCNPIFSDCASCSEIPDAIGWSSSYKQRGSIVVECKASRTDFYADKKKRFRWCHPENANAYRFTRFTEKEATAMGLEKQEIPRMGNYRYYLCEAGTISEDLLQQHANCHGLLYVNNRKVRIVRPAPRRENINHEAEIRYLRFCIINGKKPYQRVESQLPLVAL